MQVESWIMEHGTEWVGESWDELKYIRQVRCPRNVQAWMREWMCVWGRVVHCTWTTTGQPPPCSYDE